MPVNDIANESVLPVHPIGFPEHILFGVLKNLRLLLFIQVIAFVQGFLDTDPAIDFPSAWGIDPIAGFFGFFAELEFSPVVQGIKLREQFDQFVFHAYLL